MRPVALSVFILLASLTPALAQQTRPAEANPNRTRPATGPADEALVGDAARAYERLSKALRDRDYDAFARGLADNGRPMLPGDPTADEVAAVVKKLAGSLDAEKTAEMAGAAAEAATGLGPATVTDVAAQNRTLKAGAVVVKITLLGTKDVQAKYRAASTADADGNLVAYMVRQDGKWYWNPFGW